MKHGKPLYHRGKANRRFWKEQKMREKHGLPFVTKVDEMRGIEQLTEEELVMGQAILKHIKQLWGIGEE